MKRKQHKNNDFYFVCGFIILFLISAINISHAQFIHVSQSQESNIQDQNQEEGVIQDPDQDQNQEGVTQDRDQGLDQEEGVIQDPNQDQGQEGVIQDPNQDQEGVTQDQDNIEE